MEKEIHVVFARGFWILKDQGETLSKHRTQVVAVERARKIAKRRKRQLNIQGRVKKSQAPSVGR